MSVFTLEESKATGDLPSLCREVIKGYKENGKFDVDAVTANKPDYTTIYFLMTQDCNLHCPYCYQPREFRQKDSGISREIIDCAMGFVVRTFDEAKVKFSIFGGEPFVNFDMVRYLVDTYPMFPYVVTTNGLVLVESAEAREWVKSRKGTLRVSVSIGALKQKFGKGYLEAAKPALDVVRHNGGDVHFVIDDPDEQGIFEDIKYLFEYPVPVVRISTARHWDRIKDKNEAFKALFKRVADYVYFEGEPKFGRCQWDSVFHHNIYRRLKGLPIKDVPPTFCGCGYMYLAINNKGEIYPCDFFANFPEFKVGDVFNGFNETALLFKKMGEWIEGLYEDCRECEVCEAKDIRLCPRAMCLAENYIKTGNPLKPAANHCWANRVEYFVFDYIARRAIELGIK